jgi:prolyl oligopeptidase
MKNNPMINLIAIVLSSMVFFCTNCIAQTFIYPPTSKEPVTDTIFGKVIVDEYRWMEDMNNQQMKDWLKMQADFTNNLLDKIPGRDALIEEYKKLDRISKINIPYGPRKGGNRFFYMKTFANQNTPKLYYKNGNSGTEILVFDPQTFDKGRFKDVAYRFFPSKDGKKVALTLTSKGNSDIATVRIIDVDSKTFLSDSLYPVNSFQAWTPDSKGIIYGALQTSDPLSTVLFQDIEVKYHQIGQNAQEDKTIISRKNNPDLDIKAAELLFVSYSPDHKYLMATAWSGAQDQNRSFFTPAVQFKNSNINWKPLAKPEDQIRDAIIYQDKVYMLTRKGAPNFKIVVSSINQFDVKNAKTLIQESNKPIEWWKISKDFLFIQKTDGINTSIDQYNFLNGKTENINLPYSGAAWIETFDAITNDCQIDINSWHSPRRRFDYNPQTHKFSRSEFYVAINYPGTNELMVEELEVKSHDSVMVPLSLIYRKNLKKDGGNIVFMTGYGSYGSSMPPYFNTLYLPLLNKGVIIAITHPRGGGEKGYNWHMGGFKSTKPNTWKDFIACGEYLIQNRYTSAKHLIGDGTSAGGILIGRAITERPDLFAAAINNVPVSNPLRGENRPNGILDAKEFGTVKDSTEAMGLIEMDAFLHVKNNVKYPAVLAVTGINDTRVPSWQPAKFVAALQNTNSDRPMLLLVNYDSGHGSEEKLVIFKNYANQFAFSLWQAGHKDFQPVKDKP